MDGIKKALMRKIGPLPAWAWAGIAGVALFLYRRHQAANDGSQGAGPAGTLGYYGPYGQDPYQNAGGAPGDSGTGTGSGSGTTGGGGGTTGGGGPGTDPGTTPTQDAPPPPTIPVTPDTTPTATATATRTAKPKAQHFSHKTRSERLAGVKSTKRNPRSTAKFSGGKGGSRVHKPVKSTAKKPAQVRKVNPRKVTHLSSTRRRTRR